MVSLVQNWAQQLLTQSPCELQVWGNDVHTWLLLQPFQELRQTPPNNVGETVAETKDVDEYPMICWKSHVQTTYKEICGEQVEA